MSRNQSLEGDSSIEEAERLVREILENPNLSANDISPSGQLYHRIARFRASSSLLNSEDSETSGEITALNRAHDDIMARFRETRAVLEERRRRRQRGEAVLQRHQEAAARHQASVLPSPPVAIGSLPPPNMNRTSQPSSPRHQSSTPLSEITETRRAPRSLERHRLLRRHAERRRITEELADNMADLHQAGQQLQTALSHSRALIEQPLLLPSGSRDIEREYAEEAETNRAFKRRRLDTSSKEPDFQGFSYGHYGQVEPGKLNMEIESCDGGIYGEESGGDYAAANVLKNDDSVYCTKGNRCNLVLKHQGGTTFSLQELIIKAPRKGFTAPVQEGMVFVSMSSDDLLTRTAQYQIQYSPVRQSMSTIRPTAPVRYNPDGTTNAAYDLAPTPPERSYRLAQIPSDFQTPSSQPFEVTTSCSDDEVDPESPPRHRRLTGRHHPARASNVPRFEVSDSSDSEEERDPLDDVVYTTDPNEITWGPYANAQSDSGSRPTTSHRTATLAEANEAARDAARAALSNHGGELMAPHAKFFIEQDKSKCTIRFDPPVSGCFVLLKMWSPRHRPGGNIDIQSVTVKGFAGPRFFPSVQLR